MVCSQDPISSHRKEAMNSLLTPIVLAASLVQDSMGAVLKPVRLFTFCDNRSF